MVPIVQVVCKLKKPWRAGVPDGGLSLSVKQDDSYQNETGFSMQTIIDLQKVCCCLTMAQAELEGKGFTNADRLHFREATACFDYSSRVTLAMRQSQAWKCRGFRLE